MTLETILLALATGLGASAGIVGLLKVGLPWARRVVPALFATGKMLDESRVRLIAGLQMEREERERRLTAAEAETVAALAEAAEFQRRWQACEVVVARLNRRDNEGFARR